MTVPRPANAPARAGTVPTLRFERSLLRAGEPLLACVDEVGRGALAGPVTVGVVLIEPTTRSAPQGLRDSKLLSPGARTALAPKLRRWVRRCAVGHASAGEIDRVGIIAALRVAAARALLQLAPDGLPGIALLDGNHDWLTQPVVPEGLFPDPRVVGAGQLAELAVLPGRVVTRIKADLTCAGVAAASVLAKCERDAIMVGLASTTPGYGWEQNMGYGAPEHLAALRSLGPSELHRRSWRLPLGNELAEAGGTGDAPDVVLPEPRGADLRADPEADGTGAVDASAARLSTASA